MVLETVDPGEGGSGEGSADPGEGGSGEGTADPGGGGSGDGTADPGADRVKVGGSEHVDPSSQSEPPLSPSASIGKE